jgi:hypothetical protein
MEERSKNGLILNLRTMARKQVMMGGVAEISALAKKIRRPNEKWTDAIKRASAQLKKQGTLKR